MPSDLAPRLDRRHARRAQTIEEIVDVAVDVMAEHGVAGLSLGEVARRIGLRPPSLYVYFDSKHALYDAVFARGWCQVYEMMEALGYPDETTDLPAYLLEFAERFVRWTIEHPVYSQLMGWRPVPGYVPSPAAYQPAVTVLARCGEALGRLQALGLFDSRFAIDELVRVWTVLTSGVTSQQLANGPQEPFEQGAFTTLLPQLAAMFRAHYAPRAHTPASRKGSRAHQR
ncbi:MAG: TetR/AcrR family transcriptional regulator [Actinomycetota bacterium]|nr:TetR/AcrR family transcriptional regulator [Actinomycetota bacterium]